MANAFSASRIQFAADQPRESFAEQEINVFRPKFVLFGDSITQQSFYPGGWGAALQDVYARQADVIVRGYSGYNTRWCLYLLDKIFPQMSVAPPPVLVTVFFGANDAALPDRSSARQHVPLAEYKENLKRIVEHIQSISDETRIVLITPPPVDEDGRRTYARNTYGDKAVPMSERENEYTRAYAEGCLEVARLLHLPSVNLWATIQSNPNWQRLLSDGLHLTSEGNRVVYEEVQRVISDAGWDPSLAAEEMEQDAPHHSTIDHTNPGRAFSIQHGLRHQ